jgi:hypothetical protein
MGYDALNRKLREICINVGLLDYNNIYAFRREAASSTRKSHGLESAQELLNHVPSSKSAFIHYDSKGFGRQDTTASRLGGPELTDKNIKKVSHHLECGLCPYDEFCSPRHLPFLLYLYSFAECAWQCLTTSLALFASDPSLESRRCIKKDAQGRNRRTRSGTTRSVTYLQNERVQTLRKVEGTEMQTD